MANYIDALEGKHNDGVEVSIVDNSNRVKMALKACAVFNDEAIDPKMEAEDLEEAVIDLLTDLQHLCAKRALDFNSMLKQARGHFKDEG